jgi:aspartate racemase
MSWTSTAEYYRLLNQGIATRLRGLHSARLLLHSVDFAPVAGMQHDGDTATASLVIEVTSAGALAGTGWTTASEPLAALLLLAGLTALWTARRARASRLRRTG